jgi:hypothetical protein
MLNGGCDAYISKPISIPKFLQTIQRLVAEKGINMAPERVPARSPIINQTSRLPQSAGVTLSDRTKPMVCPIEHR